MQANFILWNSRRITHIVLVDEEDCGAQRAADVALAGARLVQKSHF